MAKGLPTLKEAKCPRCGSANIGFRENVTVTYDALGFDAKGRLAIDCSEPDADYDEGYDPRILCYECGEITAIQDSQIKRYVRDGWADSVAHFRSTV